jgi:hypothetical protein
MKIYRVENDLGEGPFQSGFSWSLSDEKKSQWYEHSNKLPTFREEVPGFRYSDFPGYITAVSSIDILDVWFKPFYRLLYKRGYEISEYDVDGVFILSGDLQLVFDRAGASLTKRGKRREFATK